MAVGEDNEAAQQAAAPAPMPTPAAAQTADAAVDKAAAATGAPVSTPPKSPQPESFPQLLFPMIVDMLREMRDMRQCMFVSKEWKNHVAKPIQKIVRCDGCDGWNWKEVILTCGHRVCFECTKQQRSCVLCGEISSHACAWSPLNPDDNPRSSIYPDTASVTSSTLNSAQEPYKLICTDDEPTDPFTDEELRLCESVGQWFPPPPENSRNEPVTRYWAFFRFDTMVIARVFCLPDGMAFKRPRLKMLKAHCFHHAISRASDTEEEAVKDILGISSSVLQSPSNVTGGHKTRWNRQSR